MIKLDIINEVVSKTGITKTKAEMAHIEDPESAQFNAIAAGQRILHALKHGFHCQLGLGLGDASSGDHFVDDVELDHERLPGTASG